MSPTGEFVATANRPGFPASVWMFSFDQATGALKAVPGSPFEDGTGTVLRGLQPEWRIPGGHEWHRLDELRRHCVRLLGQQRHRRTDGGLGLPVCSRRKPADRSGVQLLREPARSGDMETGTVSLFSVGGGGELKTRSLAHPSRMGPGRAEAVSRSVRTKSCWPTSTSRVEGKVSMLVVNLITEELEGVAGSPFPLVDRPSGSLTRVAPRWRSSAGAGPKTSSWTPSNTARGC